MNLIKTKPIVSKPARNAARGEACTLELPCCNGDTDTTVLAHLPDESHGMGRKSDDISACFACSACHDAIDGRSSDWSTRIEIKEDAERYMRRAQTRTHRRLIELGVMTLKGYTP